MHISHISLLLKIALIRALDIVTRIVGMHIMTPWGPCAATPMWPRGANQRNQRKYIHVTLTQCRGEDLRPSEKEFLQIYFVGLQKLKFTTWAISSKNVEPFRT